MSEAGKRGFGGGASNKTPSGNAIGGALNSCR
jgi:hypothetical protein